jgi:hypothetical protein
MSGRELWNEVSPGLAVCGLPLLGEGAYEILEVGFGDFGVVVDEGV